MPYLTSTSDGKTVIALYVQPKASKNKFCGLHGGEMKLAITSPPVDNKANKGVIQFLAKFLGVARSAITLKQGLHSRHKKLMVDGVDGDTVRYKIEQAMG